MNIIGIDPGAHGAIAVLSFGVLVDVFDMPIDIVKVGKTERARVSAAALAELLRSIGVTHAFIEQVGPTPHDGPAHAFAFGRAAGLPEMGCATLGIPYTFVTPQEWKKGVRCPADKDAATKRASQLFPADAKKFYGPRGGRLDGRAEAAMIAYYGTGLT